jgi:putative endonuclease
LRIAWKSPLHSRKIPERWPSGFPKGLRSRKALVSTMYCAYVLRSTKDGTYYYGSTSHLEERVSEHNAGKAKFTRGNRPYVLHYKESFATRSAALTRERFFKSIEGYTWLRQNWIIKTT